MAASTTSTPTADRVQSANWDGSIPIVLSLAPTSLSSPTLPPSIHALIPRHTFLHIGLRAAVLRLQEYAPTTISFSSSAIGATSRTSGSGKHKILVVEEPEPGKVAQDEEDREREEAKKKRDDENTNTAKDDELEKSTSSTNGNESPKQSPYPVCWFEDEASGLPLRWHLFAGILFDTCNAAFIKQKEQERGEMCSHEVFLPWKIRLHFTSYPSSQLLDLGSGGGDGDGVMTVVERTFKNSLKQALFLQHGNSKIAMNMTKQAHQRLWDSIINAKYSLYRQVNSEYLQPTNSAVQLLPIRLLVDSKPPLQKKCSVEEYGDKTLGQLLCLWVPEFFVEEEQPQSDKRQQEQQQHGEEEAIADDDKETKEQDEEIGDTILIVRPKDSHSISWHVAGIVPPLSALVIYLWRALSHPDHFLYIVLTTSNP